VLLTSLAPLLRRLGLGLGLAAAVVLAGCAPDPYTDTAPPVAGAAEDGRMLLRDYGCTSCHQIAGVRVPQGRVGPSLTGFADRRVVAGLLPHTPENAVLWIVDPLGVNPDTLMPDLEVSEEDAEAMLAYLYSLP
jgi:cytochrome c